MGRRSKIKMEKNHGFSLEESSEKEKKRLRAAIYVRVSTNSQTYGYSLDEQIRLCRERCELMGWSVVYIYREDGESGATLDRKKFQMMMEKAKDRAFDVLVCWKLDRFCRSLVDLINVQRQLQRYGIGLHSVTEQIDTTTSIGRFNFRSIASAAELERDWIKERSRMGMKALAMQKKWPNRLPPLGYDIDKDKNLRIKKEEVELVKYIFKKYIQKKSMPELAYKLNKKKIKSTRNRKWTAAAIKHILSNEIYIGNYNVAGVKAYIKELKVISNRTFDLARKIRLRINPNAKPMPNSRKRATIDRVFNEYFSFIEDEEQEEKKSEGNVFHSNLA